MSEIELKKEIKKSIKSFDAIQNPDDHSGPTYRSVDDFHDDMASDIITSFKNWLKEASLQDIFSFCLE